VLWEVRAPDGQISHLLGTIHLSSPPLTPQVRRLLEDARAFGMEMRFDAEQLAGVAASVIASPDHSLGARAEPALRERALTLLLPYGIDAASGSRLKPWAVWSTLALPPGQTGQPLDLVLMQAAEAAQVPVFGIETLAEQLAIFEEIPPDDEMALLRDAVCHPDEVASEREALRTAWLRGDLATLYRRSLEDDRPLQQRLMARMLHARNVRMAERLIPRFRAGGAFVAVGALHLPGKGGLLERLASAGFAVRPLD
jgi:uncharacterized protein YbaP (TraB family)